MRPSTLLILACAAALALGTSAAPTAVVIGAGVAGLKAAADLAAKGVAVTVLEGRDRVGGRVWTVNTPGGPLELGAQWIHGTNNPILAVAQTQRWPTVVTSSEDAASYEAVSPTAAKQISAADDSEWDQLFTDLVAYVEEAAGEGSSSATLASAISAFAKDKGLTPRQLAGLNFRVDSTWTQEYAADPESLSLNHFHEGNQVEGSDSIIVKGYTATLVDLLLSSIKARGGKVLLGEKVTGVTYGADGVTVTTAGKSYKATFAVVTLPLGVLKAGAVKFTPPLPADKTGAINRLAMGTLNKVILSLPAAAKLPSVNWISRIPLASDKGRWREFFSLKKATGRPVVVAFVAGKAALFPASDTDKSLGEQALAALRGILGGPANVPAPDQVIVTRWHADPFSLGSYSYSPAGADGTEREQLAAQVSNRLYFAGEATSEEAPSTVHGAYLTGEAAAGAALADHGSR